MHKSYHAAISVAEDFTPDSGSKNSRKSAPPPPYPPSLKQKGYHGLQGRPLHRLPLDLQRNGGNDIAVGASAILFDIAP